MVGVTSAEAFVIIAIFRWCMMLQSHGMMAGHAGSPTCTVYVDVTLTRSKVKVMVTGLLNFRQLAKPCILAAMTAAPLRGFLVLVGLHIALSTSCCRFALSLALLACSLLPVSVTK